MTTSGYRVEERTENAEANVNANVWQVATSMANYLPADSTPELKGFLLDFFNIYNDSCESDESVQDMAARHREVSDKWFVSRNESKMGKLLLTLNAMKVDPQHIDLEKAFLIARVASLFSDMPNLENIYVFSSSEAIDFWVCASTIDTATKHSYLQKFDEFLRNRQINDIDCLVLKSHQIMKADMPSPSFTFSYGRKRNVE